MLSRATVGIKKLWKHEASPTWLDEHSSDSQSRIRLSLSISLIIMFSAIHSSPVNSPTESTSLKQLEST
ncbi:hypothetical protein OGAPHI_000980 [Ogataea philodendri]|uniref:Uncharacterized protein n=1 Tax=Ogataea philodendri TaxID=1378263 RepID=A0A9P8PF88_9ASCO|nr:uncharacterized protein OGAPHI_000980 [Ogataea philodendri]KAH3670465.1 hypothetical protein OGAPHI_000980 [Ogataea philodendri]